MWPTIRIWDVGGRHLQNIIILRWKSLSINEAQMSNIILNGSSGYPEPESDQGLDFAWSGQGRSTFGFHDASINGQSVLPFVHQDFVPTPQPPYPHNIHELQEPTLCNSHEGTRHGISVSSTVLGRQYFDETDDTNLRSENQDLTRYL